MHQGIKKLSRQKLVWLTFGLGALFGVLVFVLLRFVAVPSDTVHYHANMSVYINGKEQQFDGSQYYEEIASCSDAHDSPKGRVHLHDSNPHVVHIHDSVVTWADLFNNFGWSLNNSGLYDGSHWYRKDGDYKLSFILNGKPTLSIANEVIGDQDRLLINYGNEDSGALQKRFATVPSDADTFDRTADPAACQGAAHDSVWSRLRRAVW